MTGASVRYPSRDLPTLNHLTLTIERGETVGVVGATGSGKSTFLQLLAGVIPHYTRADVGGQVRIFGQLTEELSFRRITSQVGLLLQDPEAQLFNLLVRDEIVWGLENHGLNRDLMTRRLQEALEVFGIQHLADRVTYDLSGGEKQRVALAAVYALRPAMVLFDDPTSQLDPMGAASVIAAIRQLAASGDITIVIVEDNVDELVTQVDRMLVLGSGGVCFDGTPRAFCADRETQEQADISAPQVAELIHRLSDRGIPISAEPLSVEEAVGLLTGTSATSAATEISVEDQLPAPVASGGPQVAAARRLSFIYPPPRRVVALQPLDLSFRQGELAAVVGRNGSGKTTLSKCLSGHLKPTHGSALVGGVDIGSLSPSERVKRVGYVFQNPDHQLFRQSVWDEVAFGLRNVGVHEPELSNRVTHVLDAVGLGDRLDDHPFRLSRGDRQRLAVASVAALQPGLLIVDEPTTGLDPTRARELLELLAELNRQEGTTVVIVSHAMDLVAEYADRTIVMADGNILADGPTRDVFARPGTLAQASVTPPPVARVALALGMSPPPVTLTEAVDLIVGSRAP